MRKLPDFLTKVSAGLRRDSVSQNYIVATGKVVTTGVLELVTAEKQGF